MKHLFVVLGALLLFVACENENDNDPVLSKNSHRIKQIIYDYEGTRSDERMVFSYEGEKATSVMEYSKDANGDWYEDHKKDVSYSGNKTTVICYDKEGDNWYPHEKYEYMVQHDLMMEEKDFSYSNGAWVETYLWTYTYSGTNLTSWKSYSDVNNDGTLEQDGKGDYIYLNGKLSECKSYELDESNTLYQYAKDTFSYTGNKFTSCTEYELDEDDNWMKMHKSENQYSGDTITQINHYTWNTENNQWVSHLSASYSYDSNGYLSEIMYGTVNKVTFEYEVGHGNAKTYWYYPEDLVHGEPTLRSASTSTGKKYIPYYKRLNTPLR